MRRLVDGVNARFLGGNCLPIAVRFVDVPMVKVRNEKGRTDSRQYFAPVEGEGMAPLGRMSHHAATLVGSEWP